MATTKVQNERSVRVGSGVLKKGGVNLGLLEKAMLEMTVTTLQIRAHNGFLPPRKKVEKVTFSAELYEINLANFDKIDGLGESELITTSPKQITGEILKKSGSLEKNSIFTLQNKSSTGAVVTAVTLKNGSETIPTSDYAVAVDKNGNSQIVYTGNKINSLSTGGLSVDYTYVPAQKRTYTVKDIIKVIQLEDVTFENVDEFGKVFRIRIPEGYNTENMKLEFGSNDKLDEVMKLPIKIEAYPDEQGRLLIIEDEQAV